MVVFNAYCGMFLFCFRLLVYTIYQFLWIVHLWFLFRYSRTFLYLGSRQIHVYSTITKHFCCHHFGFVCLFVSYWTSIFYLLNIITGKNQFQIGIHDTIISIVYKYCMTLETEFSCETDSFLLYLLLYSIDFGLIWLCWNSIILRR